VVGFDGVPKHVGKTYDAPTFAMPILQALMNAMATARLDGSGIELLTQAKKMMYETSD